MATLTERLLIRLSPEDRRRLAARAATEDRTESDLARHLLRQALAGGKEPAHAR